MLSYLVGEFYDKRVRRDQNNIKSSLPGGRLNKKDGLTRYGNSHVKDKTS